LLDAVIGLPSNLFFGAGIPAAILIFKKKKKDDSVLFIDASREFQKGKNQNTLRQQDIEKIVKTFKARETVDRYAYKARKKQIVTNDYNLNIPRYVDTFEEEAELDISAIQNEIYELEKELTTVQDKMKGYLKELGL
jgi:type I restriction enzyme M protein